MSRTTRISMRQSLLVAGILGATVLVAPATGHAQSGDGERALLNHIAVPTGATAARVLRIAAEYAISPDPIDGQRALVVRVASAPVAAADFDLPVAPTLAQARITGARALLGATVER
jgi:hypothetical protein